jgi:hypothetical protein
MRRNRAENADNRSAITDMIAVVNELLWSRGETDAATAAETGKPASTLTASLSLC